MKAEPTIRSQIRRLKRLSESDTTPADLIHRCYDSYHALRWVIEKTDWTPAGLAEREVAVAATEG